MDVKGKLKNTFIVLFMSCLILLLIEIFIRIFLPSIQPQDSDGSMIRDHVYRSSCGLKPNYSGRFFGRVVHSGEFGQRRTRYTFNRKKKTWLHIGDSVTMGVGVDDDSTFSARLAARCDFMNILNLSVIGYSARDYRNVILSLLIDHHNELNIGRISIFWCMNDLISVPLERDADILDKLRSWVRSRYRTYILLKAIFMDRAHDYYDYDSMNYRQGNDEFNKSMRNILLAKSICDSMGIQLDLVLLPYEYQYRKLGQQKLSFREQNMIQNYLQGRISVLNAGLAFELPVAIKDEYLFGDGIHFSNSGHRKLAIWLMDHWTI